MLRLLRRAAGRLRRYLGRTPDPYAANRRVVERLRAAGARIGEDCVIYAATLSTEPYLVTLGRGVNVSGGVKFLPHDGAASLLRHRRPAIQSFAPISVGDRCFIGENALILGGSSIGSDCIVAAGAVVRGAFPDNSVIAGNPAKAVGRTSLLLERMDRSRNSQDTLHLSPGERRARLLAHFGLPT